MKRISGQFAHGDVLITAITTPTAGTKPLAADNGRVILAHGEVTGHAHALPADRVNAFYKEGDDIGISGGPSYIEVVKEAPVTHEEHAAISLAPGNYEIIRQREYDMLAGVRRVAD